MSIPRTTGYTENEQSGPTEPERAWIELAATALYDLPARAVRFAGAAFTAPASAGQSGVGIAFEVPGDQFVGWRGELPFEFYIFALDNREHVIMYQRGEQVIPEVELSGRVARTGVRCTDMMMMPSGEELELRLVVRNGHDGRIGTATVKVTPASMRTPIFITDPIFPAGSSTAAGATASWLNLRGTDAGKPPDGAGSNVADPLFVWNEMQFSPDLNPFRVEGRRAVLVKVYTTRQNVALEDISIQCEMLDSSGVVLARPGLQSAAPAQLTNGHLDYLLWVNAQELPTGAATMRISAVDRVSGARTTGRARIGAMAGAE